MRYRALGNTGLELSELGFGAMRLPMKKDGDREVVDRELSTPMLHRAFADGVNYVDSATMYCAEDSQRAVGDALKAWKGGRIVVGTKNPYFGEDEGEWRRNLENSLERLQLDAIDLYHTHGTGWKNYVDNIEPRVSKWLRRAKDEGLIRHIVTSFHDNNEALEKIVDTGFFASILLQYNLLDRQLEPGIARAKEKGVGIIVMGPVGGGRLGGAEGGEILAALPQVARLPELALRFVLANPGVTVALSGMSTMAQVEENLRVVSDAGALTPEERATLEALTDRLKAASDLYCSGCGYCKPCPKGVDIPRMFELYNKARVYGLRDWARREYRNIKNGWTWDKKAKAASECVECGICEPKCPQGHPIRERLKEVRAALEEA